MANDEQHGGVGEAKLLRDLRSASIATHVAQLRTIQRMKEGVGDGNTAPPVGHCPPTTGPDEYTVLSDMVFDAVKAQLASYQGLLKLGDHGDRLFRMLRDRLALRRSGPHHEPCEVLEVVGTLGGWSDRTSFCIVNQLRRSASVVFVVGEFSDLTTPGAPFSARVEFEAVPPIPDPVKARCLAEGESRLFAMRIDLDNRAFTAAHQYVARFEVRLDGCVLGERFIRLQVR